MIILAKVALMLGLGFAYADSDEAFERGDRRRERGNEFSERARGVQMGQPKYAGSGCPAGSISAALSPDSLTLSLLFDSFIVEAGGSSIKKDYKSCQLILPFQVPRGYQATVTRMDYRGYNYIPAGARTNFSAIYYMADKSGQPIRGRNKRRVHFEGPLDEEYFVTSRLKKDEAWSGCGENFNLHLDHQLKSRTNRHNEELISTVDSADIVSNVEYHISWKRCQGSGSDRDRMRDDRRRDRGADREERRDEREERREERDDRRESRRNRTLRG